MSTYPSPMSLSSNKGSTTNTTTRTQTAVVSPTGITYPYPDVNNAATYKSVWMGVQLPKTPTSTFQLGQAGVNYEVPPGNKDGKGI